ncbi:MAG: leucyl/phenylalanyl-tRNA--protein transferase [Flammeovirgaceae bacterium]|jgi:leucyl/phenylalanyl-tRNA--protein transferase
MPIFELSSNDYSFPPVHFANPSGILAIGGDLQPNRILNAYSHGIFPWFNPEEPILWWSPDPRCIIYPSEIKVSKSMKQLFRRNEFRITYDQDFLGVIYGCKEIYRPDQQGTWISEEIIDSYLQLHKQGFIHSVEVWQGEKLVGGLYGGNLGKCFFGESMFSRVSNASKFGFISLAKNLALLNYEIIDCQVHNPHLESMGAEMMGRKEFSEIVKKQSSSELDKRNWNDIFIKEFEF